MGECWPPRREPLLADRQEEALDLSDKKQSPGREGGGGQSTLMEQVERKRAEPGPAGLCGVYISLGRQSQCPTSLSSRNVSQPYGWGLCVFCFSEQSSPDGPAIGNAPPHTAGSWPGGPWLPSAILNISTNGFIVLAS